jgi:hypothetical protein
MIPLLVLIAMSKAPPPIATLRQLGPALVRCYKPPEHSEGMQLTVRLSLTSSGALIDKPHITFSHLLGKPEDQQTFVEAVLASLAACTPVSLTAEFGNAIAGRPLTIRFIGGRSTAI